MRGKVVKKIRRLVLAKDSNTLRTIRRERGEEIFIRMSGISIYRWAKKYYRKFNKVDEWGRKYGTSN